MARYMMLRVENNETAEKLMTKFEPVESVKVVGLFVAPTKFCEGKCDNKGKSIRSKKWGTRHCPVCKLPKQNVMQQPRNLLQDMDLHPRFTDMFLSVWEPFTNDPEGKYGADAIERKKFQVLEAEEKIAKHKRKKKKNGR